MMMMLALVARARVDTNVGDTPSSCGKREKTQKVRASERVLQNASKWRKKNQGCRGFFFGRKF